MIFRGTRAALILFFSVFVLFAASRLVLRSLPGDPIETLIQETGTSLPASALREDLGLDKPFLSSTLSQFNQALHGNFGSSVISHEPIRFEIAIRLKNTFILAFASLAFGLTTGFFLALFSIYSRAANFICSLFGAFTSALPSAWIGPILAWIFGVWFHWFEISGHWPLPAFVLSLSIAGIWSRLVRERLQESYPSLSCQAARARGVSEPVILIKYALAPVSGVLFSYMGSLFAILFTGTFITEILFSWPGIGSYLVESILRRDYPCIETALFITATISLFFHRIGDALQFVINDRKGAAL